MMPNQKNIMLRFSFIILVMVLIGIAIICKAGVIMFAERQYWKDVADRFVKENVTVRPTRGNIISSDGQLMASSLPEYKIYMDFMINKRKGETEEEEKKRLKLQHIKDSVLYANLDTICKGLHEIFPDKSAAFFKQHIKNGRKKESRSWLLYPKRISYIQYKEAKRLPVFNLTNCSSLCWGCGCSACRHREYQDLTEWQCLLDAVRVQTFPDYHDNDHRSTVIHRCLRTPSMILLC